MQNQYVKLADDYALKGRQSEQVLLRLSSGARFELDADQFEFLSTCDGTRTLVELLGDYDPESCVVVQDFVENLRAVGALEFSDIIAYRKLSSELVPDIGLTAVHLEARSGCNMKCDHCYQGDLYPVENNLTLKEVTNLADQMARMQVHGVSISGGEPFLQNDLFEMVKTIEEREMRIISFFTNGLMLDEGAAANIIACHSRPTVFVSLDAITPEGMKFRGFDNPVSGGKALEVILRNIRHLAVSHIPVVVNTVMNCYNIDRLMQMYDVMRDMHVSSWRLGYPKRTGFFKVHSEESGLSWDTMAEASFALLQHHFRQKRPFHLQMEYLYREELFADFRPLSDGAFVCDYERKRETCCIKPNGDVVSCAYCTDFPVGNIRKSTLWNIWYSPEMQSVKEIRIGDVKECQGCELRQYCATGCRINAYFLRGDFRNSRDDYACQAVRFFVDHVMPFLKTQGVL